MVTACNPEEGSNQTNQPNDAIDNMNDSSGGNNNNGDDNNNVDEHAANYSLLPASEMYQILLAGYTWENYQNYTPQNDHLGNENMGNWKKRLRFSDSDNNPADEETRYSKYKHNPNSQYSPQELSYNRMEIIDGKLYLKRYTVGSDFNESRPLYYNSTDNTFYIEFKQPSDGLISHFYYKVVQ